MEFIDTHTHLFTSKFDDDITDVIKNAVLDWNEKYQSSLHLSSKNIRLFTWGECKDILMEKIINE